MSRSSRIILPEFTRSRRGFLSAMGGVGLAASVPMAAKASSLGGCMDDVFFKDDFEESLFPEPANSCVLIPSETQGPYPLLSAMSNEAMYRSDITEGCPGLPVRYHFRVVGVNNNCAPIANAALYIWQCDRDGVYSGYQQPGNNTVGQTFCRGIQLTDCQGKASFTSMYPGWYIGRITHLHFQVYLSITGQATRTSQMAFPQEIAQAVYNTALYPKGQNTSVTSFAADNVFSDGVDKQMPNVIGNTTDGYDTYLTIGIAA